MPTIHLIIKGKVQGVFYRVTARKKAQALNLSGWIKNTPEGDVEVMATGDMDKLAEFETWCRQGPEDAKVDEIQVTGMEHQEFNEFHIVR